MQEVDRVVPGQSLGMVTDFVPGPGTFDREGVIHASLLGFKRILAPSSGQEENVKPTLSVVSSGPAQPTPKVGSIVLGQVTKMTSKFASVTLQVVDGIQAPLPSYGLLRTQDIRSNDRDNVIIYECVRPGDLIRAKVISLGDSKSFYLSTADIDLGVVFANSSAGVFTLFYAFRYKGLLIQSIISGHPMVPVSWEEMICPVTRQLEKRKCAKPRSADGS